MPATLARAYPDPWCKVSAAARRAALGMAFLLGACGPAFGAIIVPCDFGAITDALAPRRAHAPVGASAGPIALSPGYLPYAYLGEPYSQSISASGGTAPYTFDVTAGSLPPGLTLDAGGLLDGTATSDGDFSFTVSSTDALGATGSRAYTLEVGVVGTIVVSPPSIPDATVDEPYTQVFIASGGTPPYFFECTGTLPEGLALDPDGTLSGTPSSTGTYDFTIVATDSSSSFAFSGSRDYSLTVQAEPVVLSPASLPDGTVGTPYDQDLDATGGGDPPYAFSLTGGALPDGLSLDGTGAIDGTPTAAGSFTFTVTATDATTEASGERDYTVEILAPTISLDPPALPDATVGVDYEVLMAATGGNGPYTFALGTGSLAPGLFLDSDGTLHGAPTEPGSFAFTVVATDSFNQTGEQAYALSVAAATIALVPTTLPDGLVGTAYHQPIAASGGTGPYAFSISAGAPPPGMGMDGDGIVDGTPETAGIFDFTVAATDAFGQVGEQAYSLHVLAPVITLDPASLPGGTVGIDFAQVITASGGNAPYTFAVTAGTLPAGLFLSSDGTLNGAPAETGSFGFTITATDNFNQIGERPYTQDVAAATIVLSPTSLADGTVGTPYHQALDASGGTAPYSFAIVSGVLPPGMAMDGDGIIDSTPTEAGLFDFTVSATDAFGQVGEQAYALHVLAPIITLDPPSLPGSTVGADYAQVITASGGNAPYTFAMSAGVIPAGLFLSSDGTLDGAPAEAGSFAFTVTATDNYNQTGERAYTLDVTAPTILLTPTSLPDGSVGAAYVQPITASGGTAPYTFAIVSGMLPPGIGMDGDGVVDGTPTEAGLFDFLVSATDAHGQVGEQAYALHVLAPVITLEPAALPGATVGSNYTQVITASGGNAPYTFAVSAGVIPAGLFLSSDGTLDGAPAEAGSFAFTVTATDNYNQTGEHAYTLDVTAPTIVLTPTSLPDGSVGAAYVQPITASGGTAPYSFAIVSGALPPGMAMDGDGIVDSTPTEAGLFDFTISATDAFGQVGEQAYALHILAPTITLDPPSLPSGTVGSNYTQVITASGGNAPYTFAVSAGVIPAGLFLSSDGTLDGAPAEAGSFAFTVTATDNYDQAGERAYTVEVSAPDIVVSPDGTLPDAVAGVAYHQMLTASGGTAPYSFEVGGGALPPGIDLSGDGTLSGTPTEAGTFAFDVVATDAFDQHGEAALAIAVKAAEIIIAPTALPAPSVGVPYQLAFEASGGVAPYTFALAGGTLPPGLALDSAGVLAGTPASDGDFVFTVAATDSIGNEGAQDYLLTLAALPDPTEDPDVTALVTSQVSTVRTFATTQIANVHHHLETLHNGGETGWSFWIAGSVRSGDRDGNGEVSPMSFETSGMTGGSDYRPNQQLAFGGGLGYARDRTAVGNDGSRNDGDAPSGVSYMSWHPEDMPLFLDGMGGYQDLEFDVRRASSGGATFLARRLGRQRFTSWQGGYEHRTDTFLFSPYGRVDAANARLDGFREQGDDPLALQFGSQAVDLRTTTLGFRMHYRMATDWGEWEPRVRVEYQRDFHEDDGVSIRYANLASSPVFFTTPTGLDEDRFVLELGSLFRTNWHGLLIRVDYLGVYGGHNDNEHGVTFSFQED